LNIKDKLNKKSQNEINFIRKKVRVVPKITSLDDISINFRPGISIVTTTKRPNYINQIFSNYLRQDYNDKELIIVLHNNSIDINILSEKANQYPNIKVFQVDESINFGECKNFAFNLAKFDYIAIFDDDDFYAPNYLKQSIAPFSYTKCDIVGKRTCFMYFEANKSLGIFAPNNENVFLKNSYVMDSSMIIKRKVFQQIGFPNTKHPAEVLTKFQDICFKNNIKIYSAHRFNYVVHRHNISDHTWNVEDEKMLKWCRILKKDVTDYSKYVVS